MTYDGSRQNQGLKLYMDGRLLKGKGEGELRGPTRTEGRLSFGSFDLKYVPNFRGQVDDIQVYGRNLSAEEVRQLAGDLERDATNTTPEPHDAQGPGQGDRLR